MESLFNISSWEFGSRVQLALVFVVTLLLGVIFQKRFHYLRYNLPPGPFSWPIVGHLPFLPPATHLYYLELAKKYGNIFSLYLGDKLYIILNDNDLIREALNNENFMGRPPHSFELVPNRPSVAEMNGPEWKEQRRSMLRALRDLGMGKTEGAAVAASNQADMVESFVEKLKRSEGQAIKVREALMHETNNLMFKLIADTTFDTGTKLAQIVHRFQSNVMKYLMENQKKYFYPFLAPFIEWFNPHVRNARRNLSEFTQALEVEVSRHEKNLEESEKSDYIDYYLQEMSNTSLKSFSRQVLLSNSTILMVAGAEATQISLEWMFMTMVQYPDVQKKVYEEIVDVVGKERLPEWNDSQFMPYTQAVYWEVMRYVNLFPVNEGRWVMEDDTLGGYDIPKGATIMMVFQSVHMDPKIWGDPEKFRPERFLSKDGKSLNNLVDNVIIFSKGKRNCPGEGLAKMNIFLYFSAVVQAFQILPPKGGLDTKVDHSVTAKLDNAKFVFKSRN